MKIKSTYIVLVLILLSLVGIAYLTPREVNWTPSYSSHDKIPYGDYILFDRLKDIFPEIGVPERGFYSFSDYLDEDSGTNYIMIADEINADDLDVRHMASYVGQGNNIFISAYALPQRLADTLGIELKNSLELLPADSFGYKANFTDDKVKSKDGYKFRHENISYEIVDADLSKTGFMMTDSGSRNIVMRTRTDLGKDGKGKVNFVRIPFGRGAFYIHSFPLAFTNYNMLKGNNSDYAAKCLSYLPLSQTYWDEYYKPFRRHAKADTPLRFVLSVPAYKWGLYVALFAILLYMVFASKRVQRIIPILLPPVNQSLEFTRTIGSLYYQQRDHRDIAVKKMIYLLEKIRQQYYLQTADTSEAFRQKLAYKSNLSPDTINGVFDIYEQDIRRSRHIDERTLIAFNTALEKFYSESGLINK